MIRFFSFLAVTWLCACCGSTSTADAASPLESTLLQALQSARFHEVYDFGPANEDRDIPPGSARKIQHPPNVDLAVLQLDANGNAVACANVLLSRDYPQGLLVPVNLDSGAHSVRFRRWDIDRWNGGTFQPGSNQPVTPKGWTQLPPLTENDDLIPGRTHAPLQFMSPYPASLFKLLVAFHILRLVDSNQLTLDTPVLFTTPNPELKPESRPLRDWLDPMITASDNLSTQALLQMLHRRSEIEPMNRQFRELGLATLQINGTRESDGRGWQTDRIHMTAFDTVRLLWLIEGGPQHLWKTPSGLQISSKLLSDSSRRYLKQLLLDQGLNEALSTANLAGAPHVQPGIPSQIAPRWIHPDTGFVTVHGIPFGVDVRPSNARAEVSFAHKTGLTYNYASDAGIVTSLPGKPFRRYIIAFFSNVGYRYTDEAFAQRTRGPYADPVHPISYTQRIPALARKIDQALMTLSQSPQTP